MYNNDSAMLTVCLRGYVVQPGGRSLPKDGDSSSWYARLRVVHSTLTTETLEGKTAGAKGNLCSCNVRVPSRVASIK